MGDMFRSEEMALCQMFIQPEAAYTSVSELGERGCVQFRDLNTEVNAFQRKFVTEVRRCDELERRIRYIEFELKKDNITFPILDEDMEPFAPNPREIVDLEAKLESIETELRELSQNAINLNSNFLEMTELKQVLEKTQTFFSSSQNINLDSKNQMDHQQQSGQLSFVAGVIKLEKFFAFERMLWRISRGNIFLRRSEINEPVKDPETGHCISKSVFVAFFQGEQLKQRVKKVCAGFHAAIYPCPNSQQEREQMLNDIRLRLQDLRMVLNTTADHRNRVLVAASRSLATWSIMIKKMKAIYHTLNMFNLDVTNKCLIGEGWVPSKDLTIVQNALIEGSKRAESNVPSFLNVIAPDEQPPTFTRTNKFTRGFQNLIDSYGMATYREINPALYTCITFPFLFAVMFGDLGHGLVLLSFALLMVLRERQLRKIKGEIFNIFFSGRYIILLMALFSLYTGFIYNDIFSKSMNVFGSAWFVDWNHSTILNNSYLQMDPGQHVSGVYAMGLDPIWQLADNKIIFLNTYKMKLSIIFGVLHMIFGVCMSLVNHCYFKRSINIIMDFLPQIIFLVLLFGYMVFMMFFKWVKYSAQSEELANTPGCAPSILILFINMMLFKHQEPLEGCEEYLFEQQELVQRIFVIIALACIPWMLLGKPLYLMCCKKKKVRPLYEENVDVEQNPNSHKIQKSDGRGHAGHDNDDEPMSEIFIQQAIHTIEYVLSTISHTASYLRLWALSLAHAQLSEVLWGMVFAMSFSIQSYFGAIFLFVIFIFWSLLTIGILVLIEGLSAFLHTLRLHWVEFMSKFYEGLGYAFQPFSFKTLLEGVEE
ncbi:V-type proton ATPase 116 kDa subunit a1-like [Glossina fuscipes]|uniref:V-type proton ATPase subunit a n=1 Tax=Glossina fuscipes TaxID=7396 RepID=A0A9C6DMU8_9MUSC|nr:V-type proton ATPase 116 kDa subunit a1-like [Glossina fuscipes]XP_037894599.1 V-type proton ATPase 116 kDa subunit a1-like [Glossina fuscipes]XP_037894600.1 V-type proton ATPase 116 kDa subunit a1-like [Glossina fuscipes]XP_037894601.1 V-type proton ATPase 116 kDa subunit a1-like [Glossina fuscipes]